MNKLTIMLSAGLVTGLLGSAAAETVQKPQPRPDSNQSCVAAATLAFKNKQANGNNGNGVAVREQAMSGTRGEGVRDLAQSCKGNEQRG